MRSRVKRLWIFLLASTYGGLLFYAASTAPPQQSQRICLAWWQLLRVEKPA
jgi:hypothetical protein